MRRRAGLVGVALIFSLVLTGCELEFEEFGLLAELFASDDPVEQAAGHAAEAQKKDKEAQDLAKEGVESDSIEKVNEASRLRPFDPRYKFYKAAMQLADGDQSGYMKSTDEAIGIIETDRERFNQMEAAGVTRPLTKTVFEQQLEALKFVLGAEERRKPRNEQALGRLRKYYCSVWKLYVDEPTWVNAPSFLAVEGFLYSDDC